MRMTDLEKRVGGFTLRIGSLRLMPGRVYGLIGPNGSGKTTAMKLMAGLLKPEAGAIDYEGLTQRDITMAPRKPYFLHDSVYRNLTYPLALRGIKADPARVDHYLEVIGLKDRRNQYAPSLSTGEQQKLSVARALIFSPSLILIDEAFSNLDIESMDRFERFILDRQRDRPATWVVVSHQLSIIQRLCSHLFFMEGGTVEAEGPAEELLTHPQNPLLKRYLTHVTISRAGAADGIFKS
ncbi:MAG: ABC transporter ATP-binding protein [Clostridia bacterium]|nr:ABC transporter ATP-binding protein [Clostridia bacterium]